MSIAEAIKLSHDKAEEKWPTGWEAINAPDYWSAYYLCNNALFAGKNTPEREGYSPSDLNAACRRLSALAECKTACIHNSQRALGIR